MESDQVVIDTLISSWEALNERERATKFVQDISRSFMTQDVELTGRILRRILEYSENTRDTILIINSKALLAEYFWRTGNYDDGIKYAVKAAELASDKPRFFLDEARALQVVGTIHFFNDNPETATDFYKKSALAFQRGGEIKAYISAISNVGAVYTDMGEKRDNASLLDSAVLYLKKTISYGEVTPKSIYLA
ncbi:MAG: tetratricopeptide repeat protein, partial [Bacteroidota bacterium]